MGKVGFYGALIGSIGFYGGFYLFYGVKLVVIGGFYWLYGLSLGFMGFSWFLWGFIGFKSYSYIFGLPVELIAFVVHNENISGFESDADVFLRQKRVPIRPVRKIGADKRRRNRFLFFFRVEFDGEFENETSVRFWNEILKFGRVFEELVVDRTNHVAALEKTELVDEGADDYAMNDDVVSAIDNTRISKLGRLARF